MSVHEDHKSVFSGMFSSVLEDTLELGAPTLGVAGASANTDSSSSSEAAVVEAELRPGVAPGAGLD